VLEYVVDKNYFRENRSLMTVMIIHFTYRLLINRRF